MSAELPPPEDGPVGGPASEPSAAAGSLEQTLVPEVDVRERAAREADAPLLDAPPSEPDEPDRHESHAHDDAFRCLNCGAENRGEFCSRCGQKRLHDGDLTLKHAWHFVLHEMLHVDGKLVSTLRQLLTRPGQLTLDFVEGRRTSQVNPVQLLLLFSA